MSPLPLSRFTGTWKGQKRLWPSPDGPVRVCESVAVITTVIRDRGLVVRYTWEEARVAHAGVVLLQQDAGTGSLTAAWTDSWHQPSELMICRSTRGEHDRLEVRGSYGGLTGPAWGWTIAFESSAPDLLVMRMFNISPHGESALAVEATYRRA